MPDTATLEAVLVKAQLSHAKYCARQVVKKYNLPVDDVDDLKQIGLLHFLDAIRRYKPGIARIDVYARNRLYGSIHDAAITQLSKSNMPSGGFADDFELDGICLEHGDPADIVCNQELLYKVFDYIETLPDKQKEVVKLIYGYGYTAAELARRFEVTESSISQAHKKAIAKIKKLMRI